MRSFCSPRASAGTRRVPDVLLDTHAVLWWAASARLLSARARNEISRTSEVLISPVSCWEISTLVRLGRIRLDRDVSAWIAGLFARDRVIPASLGPAAAAVAGALGDGFPGDPADRMLYATARDLAVPFVTKDRRIRAWAREIGDVKTIW